jgi:hypothetical protein
MDVDFQAFLDPTACSSVWKTDGFLAVYYRIIETSSLEYIFTRKCPLPFYTYCMSRRNLRGGMHLRVR